MRLAAGRGASMPGMPRTVVLDFQLGWPERGLQNRSHTSFTSGYGHFIGSPHLWCA
jgi:hypothetical protein